MTHLTHQDLAPSGSVPASCDIAVVGAGMSGLYLTWRLLQHDPALRIVILEKLDRTGGRLDSDVIDFGEHDRVKEEEGGMRFTFDLMDDLMALLVILGIDDQVVPFPMNSGGNNRLHFRGRSFTQADAQADNFAIWSTLYRLDPVEQGLNPPQLIDTIFNRILSENPQFTDRPDIRTPTFWQDFRLDCQWRGVALKDWTLWGLLDAMGYSSECITLLYRLLGFNGTFLSEMNAGEAFQLLEDFPDDPGFKTIENGFSTLPNALVAQIGADRIHTCTTVERLDPAETGYTLSYTERPPGGEPASGRIEAKQVVLGLPRLALEELFVGSNALNRLDQGRTQRLWNTLQTTTDQPLLKMNLYYERAWWGNNLTGEPPVSFGPNFSDLPLGSVYPFYSISEEVFAAAAYQDWLSSHPAEVPPPVAAALARISAGKYDHPAALTIYCDYLNINFWRALQQGGALFDSPLQRKYTEAKDQRIFPASVAVVEAATRMFRTLFNTHYVPAPVLTSARIWRGATQFDLGPADQVGYGVHQWGLHADDREVMRDLVQPLPGLFTCGEAFSDYQGWVEGALRSTDLVLAEGFGLDPISDVFREEHGRTANEVIAERYGHRSTALIRKYVDPDFEPSGKPHPTGHRRHRKGGFGVAFSYFDRPVHAGPDSAA